MSTSHPLPGEPTKENGGNFHTRRSGKTVIQNSELHESLVNNNNSSSSSAKHLHDNNNMLDLERGHGTGSFGGGESGSLMQNDPYYVVKEDVLIKLELAENSFESYQHTVECTDTAVNTHEVKETKKQLKRHIKHVESTLRDLETTVRLVENKRDKFTNIDDNELYDRKSFVSTCADRIKQLKNQMNSNVIKKKLMADERSKTKRRLGFKESRSQEVQEDAEFLESTQASSQLMLRQQDECLDELDEAVERVGHMAGNIHEELGQQNKILKTLEEDLDDAEEKLGLVMGKLGKLLKTKSKWQLGTILALSLIVLILLFLVLYT